ncbi:GNAT family N-acetyltransferase [Flavobacteriaceae bacterium]|jgi:ribosomal protein S18 acetylase RimI-like enzyme|nr:GNAT family N-acetyltransferase [Flavobacteriaceae bacterium]MDB0069195.1 GNAT family N-acetyltransferase [Flavobacteriaceae bacterium]MDB4148131.1 GNAT family N-acetyltransferase [Flavobacteriaceae bacterium]MDB9976320.1 GNAT family N-acetyltransferase [Flavobacteriaceae bacterium]MDC1337027.1 GNAT family N-acetyltransferase [Flavobacteriaceae bacterium]|tara:strand:+ start:4602 stop:5000 length:399 start_codon:yes stop_codon:yes gene_type:complete
MKIRELAESDYNQVIELWTKSLSNKFDNEINTSHLSDPGSITLVSVDNNTITGVASLYIIKKLTRTLGLIEDVAVNENYRGKGIGKKLVEKLIGLAADKKCDKTVLNSSEQNSEFYKKIGFEINEIQMIIRN